MTAFARPIGKPTFCNPVYNQSFPDPFVLKAGTDYFAYCTGFWKDGNVFGVLHSNDLVEWREIGGAMQRLDTDAPFYWAPEVTCHSGRFYLYYSVGNETLMEIRLAVSESPDRGFVDSGIRLTSEEFAIDPHVFTDRDGTRYMFYATDFLTHSHIGTGTVVDRMIDWQTLEGKPRPVTRAKYDWQVYDPQRKEKGGVRWHTVEGPFVLQRKGRYYEMFSGGNWQNTTYGVSFARSDRVFKEGEWEQFSDGEKVLPILRTVPERIVGPGHNSVVRGPNNRELFCVYHRWTGEGRVLAIDRMDFAGDRLFIIGATDSPQPAPFVPKVRNPFFNGKPDGALWSTEGTWSFSESEARCEISEKNALTCCPTPRSFLVEVSFRCLKTVNGGAVRFSLADAESVLCEISIQPHSRQASILWREFGQTREEIYGLPEFAANAVHTARIDANGKLIRVSVDGIELPFRNPLHSVPDRLSLIAAASSTAFSDFALTEGFEELFEETAPLSENGWNILAEQAELSGGEFTLGPSGGNEASLSRPEQFSDFELAVNFRLIESRGADCRYGLQLLDSETVVAEFGVDAAGQKLYVAADGGPQFSEFTAAFVSGSFNQLRILKLGDSMTFSVNERALWNITSAFGELKFRIFCRAGAVSLDMVRFTAV